MIPSNDTNAALFAAAEAGDIEQASAAVAAGGDVNAANAYHVTPLLEAMGQGHLEMVQWLVDRGAAIDYTEMGEGSPLMLAAFMGQDDFLRLFIAAGANVNVALPNGGETALHMAAATGKTASVKLLLEVGGDPNLHTKTGVETSIFDGHVKLLGETPLHFAAAYGDIQMIQAMLLAGADRQAENSEGETPLAYAERHRRERAIFELLS